MRVRNLLYAMLRAYCVITTGITASTYICLLLFKPSARLSPADIGSILLCALISDLSLIIFCSKKELSKRQMAVRFCIHLPLLTILLITFAHIWNWIDIRNPVQISVFILLVLSVYAFTLAAAFYQDRKLADRLNERLKKKYHS